jgi:hypothetical protein
MVNDSSSDRRSFIRKVAGLAALGALTSIALERLPVPVSAATAGDVAFSDGTASGVAFDHPNFFWDSANHRLGIGTATPNYPLEVISTSAVYALHLQTNASYPTAIIFDSQAGQQAYMNFLDGGVQKFQVGKNADNTFFFWDQVNLHLFLYVNPSSKIIALDPSALPYKVGIGTASPSQTLTVAGDVGQSVVSANGLVKAAALVNGSTPSIISGFNNLPGGSGPTVSQPLGPGTYEVNFGVNIAQRFFLATLLSSNQTYPNIGANDGQVLVSPRDGNANAVFVRTNDSTGTNTNRSFYLMIF